jgi:hypothetical protein
MRKVFIKENNMGSISYSNKLVIVASLFIATGCESTFDTGTSGSVNLPKANSALSELVQDTSCTASFQCKVLEVGQRACGGPSRYVVYSNLNTEQETAELLAQQITEQETRQNQASGASDCSPVLPVQALCIDKQCQAFEIK